MDFTEINGVKMETGIFQDWKWSEDPLISPWLLLESSDPSTDFFPFPYYDEPLLPQKNYGFEDCEKVLNMWVDDIRSLDEDEDMIKAVSHSAVTGFTGGEGSNGGVEEELESEIQRIEVDKVDRYEENSNGKYEGRMGASNSIEFDDLRRYFYIPITQAAKELKVGLTVLKKRCRELGISRWPNRKFNSLKALIDNVKQIEETGEKLERLEDLKRLMERDPEMQLTEETKRWRQACFKANYKKRTMAALV